MYRIPLLLLTLALVLTSCGKRQVDAALESDANGYVCTSCKAKFYTEREVFATRCPECSKPTVEQVLGFVCSADNAVTIAGRGSGTGVCEKCRKPVNTIKIPNQAELQAWGAAKKSGPEVGG